MISVMAQDREY